MIQVGILGAAGLSGQELLQRLAGHPEAEVRVATLSLIHISEPTRPY